MKSAITAALLTLVAAASATEAESKSTITVSPNVTGKATITIQANGKTETREINLDNATKVDIRTDEPASGKGAWSTWLGVTPDALSEEVAAQLPLVAGTGLLVRSVAADGPAAQAGLKKNDVLAKLDDQILANADQLRTLIAARKEGDKIRVTYYRQGKEGTVEVTLGAHEGGDSKNRFELFFNSLKNGSLGTALKPLENVIDAAKQAVVTDKDGRIVTPSEDSIAEASRQLEKTLKDAGLNEESVRAVQETFAKTAEQIRRAVGNAADVRIEVKKQAEEVRDRAKKLAEDARHAAEERAAKAADQARQASEAARQRLEAAESKQ